MIFKGYKYKFIKLSTIKFKSYVCFLTTQLTVNLRNNYPNKYNDN